MLPQQQSRKTLARIFSEVLASTAFMFTSDQEAEGSVDGQWLETAIAYDGPQRGTLRFLCTRAFAVLLAANLLGTDPEDPGAEATAVDAVKELMNIVCGQFITAAYGSHEVFQLTIPTIRELPEAPDLGDSVDPRTFTIAIDDHRVRLSLETCAPGVVA